MTLRIAIGYTNPTKVRAVRDAVQAVWPDAILSPCSRFGRQRHAHERRRGARGALSRARRAREALDADLAWPRRAAHDTPEAMYLTNWVAIVDRNGRSSLANGGRLPLPSAMACELRTAPSWDRSLIVTRDRPTASGTMALQGISQWVLCPATRLFRIAVAFALRHSCAPSSTHRRMIPIKVIGDPPRTW
jgi:non-canonical (house-cleaning) NTP pyrophosphatase